MGNCDDSYRSALQKAEENRIELTALCSLVRQGAELLMAGALPNSFAVQDYLNALVVRKILEAP